MLDISRLCPRVKRTLAGMKRAHIDFTCKMVIRSGNVPRAENKSVHFCSCTGVDITSYVDDPRSTASTYRRNMDATWRFFMPFTTTRIRLHVQSPQCQHLKPHTKLSPCPRNPIHLVACPCKKKPMQKTKVCSTLFQRKRHDKSPLPQSVYDR